MRSGANQGMLYDLFICHASEDKGTFVRPLAKALRKRNVEVWYDEFSLKLGDSIRRSLDKGLKQSRFGVVVLSKAFFDKQWPQYELDGLVEREMKGRDKVILPVWHAVTHDDVMKYSPPLAGRKAVSSMEGIEKVAEEIFAVVHPRHSPLIIARDMLLDWGITPPVITDEYWLRVVEASNRVPGFGASVPEESSWDRWSFPLPDKEKGAIDWGKRLAWTAMQLNWVKTSSEIPITPLTPPKDVLNFIDSHPGLFETCRDFPGLVIEYAPQLSIPGFEGKLEDVIEEEYRKSCAEAEQRRSQDSRHGSALTVSQKSFRCDEEWALRHPTFGNYEPAYVANAYFSGGLFGPRVSPYDHADHLFWLLSSASSWLPEKIHATLLTGMATWTVWPWWEFSTDHGGTWKNNGKLASALHESLEGRSFKWTAAVKDDLLHRIEFSIQRLSLPDTVHVIKERFLSNEFHTKFIESEKSKRMKRSSKGSRDKKIH